MDEWGKWQAAVCPTFFPYDANHCVMDRIPVSLHFYVLPPGATEFPTVNGAGTTCAN